MKLKNNFHVYAIITILGWSLAYPLTKLSLNHFSIFSLGFLRYLIASITIFVIIILMKIKIPKINDFPWFLLSGAIGFFLYMITFNYGTKFVSAATSSLIIATVPILTSILAKFFYKEQLKTYQWIAVGIEFTGIMIITIIGKGGFSISIGAVWLIIASLLLSSYNIIQRKLIKKYSSIQVSSYSIFCGTLMLAIFAPISINEIRTAPEIQFIYLLILGIFSSAIAYLSWTKAFAKAENTSQVSNYMFMTPILASILGYFLLGEIPQPSIMVGGLVIISGFILFNQSNFIINNQKKKKSRTTARRC